MRVLTVKKLLLLCLPLLLLPGVLFAAYVLSLRSGIETLFSENYSEEKFQAISPGMTLESMLQALGSPIRIAGAASCLSFLEIPVILKSDNASERNYTAVWSSSSRRDLVQRTYIAEELVELGGSTEVVSHLDYPLKKESQYCFVYSEPNPDSKSRGDDWRIRLVYVDVETGKVYDKVAATYVDMPFPSWLYFLLE